MEAAATRLVMWPGSESANLARLLQRPFIGVPREELLAMNEAMHGRRVLVKSDGRHTDEPYEGVFLHFTVEEEDGSYLSGIHFYDVRLYARELRLETMGYGSTAHIPAQNIEEMTILGPQLHRCWNCMRWDRRGNLVHEFGTDPATGEFNRLETNRLTHARCEE